MATKLKAGDKIVISKKISIDKGNKFVLDVGETFKIEAVSPTGAVKISKRYSTGELKRAEVSSAYYKRV